MIDPRDVHRLTIKLCPHVMRHPGFMQYDHSWTCRFYVEGGGIVSEMVVSGRLDGPSAQIVREAGQSREPTWGSEITRSKAFESNENYLDSNEE